MRRRDFISFIGSAAATWSLAARAQQYAVWRIGLLMAMSETDRVGKARVAAFRDGLRTLGLVEGSNIALIDRWALPTSGRLQSSASELIALEPAVIMAGATPSVAALLKTTHTIPIVFAVVSDPIGSGFVTSLARPGGNATGFTNYEATLGQKWLEILNEIAPAVTRVAVLFNPKTAAEAGEYYLRPIRAFAGKIGVEIVAANFSEASDIGGVIEVFARKPNGGLLVLADATTIAYRTLIIDAAARHRLPAVYTSRDFTVDGGLVAYSADDIEQFRRAASYVDRILKGENPGELPVQAPTKFEFVINLKTARSLGLEVTPTLLARADEVIE